MSHLSAQRRTTRAALSLFVCGALVALTSCTSSPTITAADAPGGSAASASSTTAAAAPTTTAKPGAKPCAASKAPALAGKPTIDVPTDPRPSQLVKTDLTVGTGTEAKPGGTVTVHYVGISCSTGEQFDASWDSGDPATFSLNRVIKGWGDGIPGMKVGGRRLLIIPPDLAYGDNPPSRDIAPGETLIFVVDLIKV